MTRRPTLRDLIETVQHEAGDDVGEQLATARGLVAELNAAGDAVLGHFVYRARRSGWNWVQISDALGVTKQAVHRRFAMNVSGLTYERLTPRAKRSLDAATEHARSLGHGYLGTEHILLGLYSEPEGVAAKILVAAGIGPQAAEAAVLTLAPRGGGKPKRTDLPHTPRTNAVLSSAVNEALELGHNYVGTEHLLLGLYQVPAGLAAQILQRLGLDEDAARREVVTALSALQQAATGREDED
ncbi:Clp protease N-terminal domain-containing protein [Actinopolymorpha alba]|uniref:Clp protease N-terminal domain-containing protein n=1 Tax=Actinopolymorpha alba TaxID=533267 RepID=UPI0003614A82|nr:Clp protease N-terminal domain-containing protein [Actinopolymorpha alba]